MVFLIYHAKLSCRKGGYRLGLVPDSPTNHLFPSFLRATVAMTFYSITFLEFLQPAITTFHMAMPFESIGAEYLLQIIKLHSIWEILRDDPVLSHDAGNGLKGPFVLIST